MNQTFLYLTIGLIVISVAMILIILVQRPQGGGLASAFGGAGGGNDTVFGGRVGDALTVMTVIAFILFLGLAVALNLVESKSIGLDAAATAPNVEVAPSSGTSDHPVAPTPDHPVAPASETSSTDVDGSE